MNESLGARMRVESEAQGSDVSRPSCLMDIADAVAGMDQVVERILWARLTRMRSRLYGLLACESTGMMAESIRTMFQDMAPDHRARVLMSSEFCEHILSHESTKAGRPGVDGTDVDRTEHRARALSAIHDVIAREKAIAELSCGNAAGYLSECRHWAAYSPMGDYVARKDSAGCWALHRLPTIAGCITLDLESPQALHHEPRSGVLSQRSLPMTEGECRHVSEKLCQAMEAIDRAEPMYGSVVRNFVRRIIVRKSEEVGSDAARHYGSEHVPRQPGSIRLLNTHHPELSVEACMESIMHESTHNFLAAWELTNGFFVANDYKYRVVSPWSGNPIPNSSYVHAVFVYYVCHRLLKNHLESSPGISAEAETHIRNRLSVCAAGFLIEQKLSSRVMVMGGVNSDIGQMIDQMQECMKLQYRYGERK